MKNARCMAVILLLAVALSAVGFAPVPFRSRRPARLPVGRWTVKFANSVVETCEVWPDKKAAVIEPRRASPGRAEPRGGAVVITFDDDRVERWTAKGNRIVVEHWFPGSQYPAGPKVMGVATRLP